MEDAMKRLIYLSIAMVLMIAFVFCAGRKEAAFIPESATDIVEQEEEPVAEVTEQIEPEETTVSEPEPEAVPESLMFDMVHFDFDKSDLMPITREILADHAQILMQYPSIKILIEGHCDERGTIEYNLALGERRAASVKTYLINYGIHPSRMSTISYGKERPLDPRQNEEAWAANRRAAFRIVEK